MNNNKIAWFLFRFLGSYLLLFITYNLYLNITEHRQTPFTCDPITTNVAQQSGAILNYFNQNVVVIQDNTELCVKMLMHNYYILGVIEGCNAVSIMILFLAFIIAFKGTLLKTILFTAFGITTIYYVNIFRISFLAYGFYYFGKYQDVLHDLVFPTIIYGYIVLLWIFWIKYFSNLKK